MGGRERNRGEKIEGVKWRSVKGMIRGVSGREGEVGGEEREENKDRE